MTAAPRETTAPSPQPVTPAQDPPGAALVGERTVPGLWHENYWFRRHEIAYRALAPLAACAAGRDGVILEAGCGEGYGVRLLAEAGPAGTPGPRIAALDYDAAAVAHAAARYPEAGYARGNLAVLPFTAGSVAAVVSFQVIEHLWTPWEFLAECARVLRPGGPLVVTTPNRPTFSPGLGRLERPPNPYHVREYDAAELRDTVAAHLTVRRMLGVVPGSRLREWEARHGDLVRAQLAAPPDDWSPGLAAMVRDVRAEDFEVVPIDPATGAAADGAPVLDLVVVAGKDPA